MNLHGLTTFTVTHNRLEPKRYRFTHSLFWFKIDLLKAGPYPSNFVSFNKPNLFSFYDKDHLTLICGSAKENYCHFAKENGLRGKVVELYIYTQLRCICYVFNPVSFIFGKNDLGERFSIIEICNTFNELKPFYVSPENFKGDSFNINVQKHFYISPFIRHDNMMNFIVKESEKDLSINIEDKRNGKLELNVNLKAQTIKASTGNLLKTLILKPLPTFIIIFLIHFHAFKLFLKGIKYFKKDEHIDLQRGALKWK